LSKSGVAASAGVAGEQEGDVSGCSAALVVVVNGFLCCANAGNTRVILCRNGLVRFLWPHSWRHWLSFFVKQNRIYLNKKKTELTKLFLVS